MRCKNSSTFIKTVQHGREGSGLAKWIGEAVCFNRKARQNTKRLPQPDLSPFQSKSHPTAQPHRPAFRESKQIHLTCSVDCADAVMDPEPGIYAHATLEMQDQAAGLMDEIVSPVALVVPQLHPTHPICIRKPVSRLSIPRKCPQQTKHR